MPPRLEEPRRGSRPAADQTATQHAFIPMPHHRLSCPRCHTVFQLANPRSGTHVLCPSCQSRLALPAVLTAPPVWYYARGQQKVGPVSATVLKRLAAEARLLPTDMVWKQGAQKWVAAGLVKGLFDRSAPIPSREAESDDVLDVVGQEPANERQGPLSIKGLRVRPNRSLTLGDFRIIKKLGAGGMGAVYLADQLSLRRRVALKVLSRQLASQPAYVQRFFREASVLASLDHPNIVRFHGVGEERGFHYFAMEFLDGFNMPALLERRGGRLGVGDALHVVLQCAAALRYAHEHQIVHRDVKPENIMITRLGHLKITDLGLAKPMDEDLSLTDSGTGVGTPRYMAPEQGRDAKHADHRCDIYALGGVLYYLLTGRPPFLEDSAIDLLLAKEQGFFPSARHLNDEVPPRLDLMIGKMLARDVKHRYQSCAELVRDLESLHLANEHLSFNPLWVENAPSAPLPPPAGGELAEILLIQDDPNDVLLAQEALEQSGIPSNLNVVGDGREALAFLHHQGKYAAAPRPNLIILGRNLLAADSLEVLTELQEEALRDIPVVVLTTVDAAPEGLESHGIRVTLNVTKPNDVEEFQNLIKAMHSLCQTVVQS